MSRNVKIWLAGWAGLAGVLLWQQGCEPPREPIEIADGAVIVRNLTDDDWLDVRIWINEHYSGGARSIPSQGFVRESLGRFVAAQGQRLNVAASRITSVVVLGRTPDGTRVRIAWGTPQLH